MAETKEQPKKAEGIVLPTQKVKALTQSPKNLIIYSAPKVGKTELLAGLENNLILDLEDGSDFVDALKVKAKTVQDIKAIGVSIKEAGYPYDYVTIDTVTALETICIPYAEILYARTSMGKNWFKKDKENPNVLAPESGKMVYGDITNMPNGAGYKYLRQAYTNIVEHIKTFAPRLIQLGHVKDTQLEKNGATVESADLDLTGKIKRMATSQSDAIGYLYRDKSGTKNILSFKTKGDLSCGARPTHLSNKEIVISEMTDKGLKTHWNEVYID
jgi:hypothetical protein